jgi:hypothetical protein
MIIAYDHRPRTTHAVATRTMDRNGGVPLMSRNAIILLASLILGTFSLCATGLARAEGNCPPGMFPIGGGSAGWEGCAPMGGGDEDEPYEDEDSYRRVMEWTPPTPQELAEQARYRKELEEQARRHREGAWELVPGDAGLKGSNCQALFYKQGRFVGIRGPGAGREGAVISFWGKKVPKPRKPKTVKASLIQGRDPEQVVQAYNYTSPWAPTLYNGTLSFAVPSVDALLSSMQDVQEFRVRLRGRTVAEVQWHGGLATRNWLKKCIAGKL